MVISFDALPACDERTDGQTDMSRSSVAELDRGKIKMTHHWNRKKWGYLKFDQRNLLITYRTVDDGQAASRTKRSVNWRGMEREIKAVGASRLSRLSRLHLWNWNKCARPSAGLTSRTHQLHAASLDCVDLRGQRHSWKTISATAYSERHHRCGNCGRVHPRTQIHQGQL